VSTPADAAGRLGAATPSPTVPEAVRPDVASVRGIRWALTPGWSTNSTSNPLGPLQGAIFRAAQGRGRSEPKTSVQRHFFPTVYPRDTQYTRHNLTRGFILLQKSTFLPQTQDKISKIATFVSYQKTSLLAPRVLACALARRPDNLLHNWPIA